MTLTIDELFTPAASGVGLNPNTPPADGTWLASLLDTASALGLATTAWQPGGPERTILAIAAVALSQEDGVVSLMAQGGFIDFAASGTVTVVAVDGTSVVTPVTPDPSNAAENPTGAPGWLDALGQSVYDEERLQATAASGQLAIANTTAGVLSYLAGNYHVANTNTGATYANADDLTISSSIIAGSGGTINGIVTGVPTIVTTLAAHGLAAGQVVYITGANGVTGLNGAFATITSVPSSTTFQIGTSTSGTWTSGGTVYLCTVANFAADAIGIASNASPGAVSTTVTANIGVSVYNLTAWSATNYESNLSYAARLRLKLGSLSPNGPAAAYEYFALTAVPLLADLTPPVELVNGPIVIATTFSNPQTGQVTTLVASSTPASETLGEPVTPGCAQLGVTGATNASPIEITTAAPHTLDTDNTVTISGVLGNTAANGTWTIIQTGNSTLTLNDSVGSGTYTGGGTVEGGDLGQVDRLIQDNVVPDGQVALVQSALAFPIAIVATVVIPAAYASVYPVAAAAQIQALLATYPIGGNIQPGESDGTVPYSAIEGALVDAGSPTSGSVSYVRQVSSLTINGGTSDLTYPTPEYVAILVTPTINVVLV